MRAAAALRAGIAARGLPEAIYLDNGSGFVSGSLLRACAVLGVRLIHSRPGRPQGRGKIERVFRTVREQFLVEVDPGHGRRPGPIEPAVRGVGRNRLPPRHPLRDRPQPSRSPRRRPAAAIPDPGLLREAFLWSETRTVTKTATVSMHANLYEVDAALVGRKVELVFDPFDLAVIEVRWNNRPMGDRGARHASAATPIPQPAPKHPPRPQRAPGSTTWPWSKPAGTAPTKPASPTPASAGRQPARHINPRPAPVDLEPSGRPTPGATTPTTNRPTTTTTRRATR